MDPAALAVVEKSIHGLLKHSLFIADDEFRSPEFDQFFQTVVAVDHPAIEIIEVRWWQTVLHPAGPRGADREG